MRKNFRRSRTAPFAAGLSVGYTAAAVVSAAGALIMWATGADSGAEWLAAILALAAGSFLCGRAAGKLRRRNGLKTGAVCGVVFIIPLLLLGLIFGRAEGAMLPVKLLLCLGFSAAGGVSGVNAPEK